MDNDNSDEIGLRIPESNIMMVISKGFQWKTFPFDLKIIIDETLIISNTIIIIVTFISLLPSWIIGEKIM